MYIRRVTYTSSARTERKRGRGERTRADKLGDDVELALYFLRRRPRRALKLQRGAGSKTSPPRREGSERRGCLESILESSVKVRVPSRYLNEITSTGPAGKAEHPDVVQRDLWGR